MEGACANESATPDGFNTMLETAFDIEEELIRAKPPEGVCHNDLVTQNFIRSAGTLKLLDFDCAGHGPIAAGLSSAASQFEPNESET